MRLTNQIIHSAPSYLNALGDRTLSLRSLDLPLLEQTENLKDIHHTLDITDNDLRSLGSGLPVLARLKTVLAANNRISTVQSQLSKSAPHLTTLSLINNSIADFQALQELKKCASLENLYLRDNPVCAKDLYREFVIWLVPTLRVLDFERVTQKERQRALELFGSVDEPTALAKQQLSFTERVEVDKEGGKVKLTDGEKAELKEQLKKATSLVEIDRIETALKTGYFSQE